MKNKMAPGLPSAKLRCIMGRRAHRYTHEMKVAQNCAIYQLKPHLVTVRNITDLVGVRCLRGTMGERECLNNEMKNIGATRAEEARASADTFTSPQLRMELLALAERYERMAERTAGRSAKRQKEQADC